MRSPMPYVRFRYRSSTNSRTWSGLHRGSSTATILLSRLAWSPIHSHVTSHALYLRDRLCNIAPLRTISENNTLGTIRRQPSEEFHETASILATMDQDQGIEKARQFARMRYTGETENIVREHEQKRVQMRAQLAARGILMSGTMINESARIDGEQIKAMTQSRIDAILEGYELYGVDIDEQMAINI